MRLVTTVHILSPFLLLPSIEAALECRPPGPIVPRPRNVTGHASFTQATDKLTRALESALAGDIAAGWPVENTSFSIGLITHDQNDGAVPAWEYHHLASTNVNGSRHLTRDSQFLIGSISKVISDYILLQSGVDLDKSVAAYIPELADAGSLISWDDITLRHLANQVAGIPPNYGFSEYYYLKGYFESLGFPQIGDDAYAPCGILALNGGCTREQFLRGMVQAYPVARPAEEPVYSNIAFTLLMYAVQAQTGKNYTELLETYVSGPLGLTNTLVSPGDDDKAIIPPVENSWGSDYGDNAPGGGLVSSLSDLSVFIHKILDRTIFDSDTAVRAWLKPTSSTGSLNSLVGTPWEVFRRPDLTPDHPHVVDIYAKGGAAYGYQSQIAVIDEYGAGIVLLTAGSALAVGPIYDAVLSTLVPALDEVAREQAFDDRYAGIFVDGATPSSPGNASAVPTSEGVGFNVSIALDQDSLVLQGLQRNGSDILASLKEIWFVTLGQFLAPTPTVPRIFPTDIEREGLLLPSTPDGTPPSQERRVIRQDWRLQWDFAQTAATELPGAGLSAGNCLTWTLADWLYYGSEPVDRVVFVLDAESREVVGLEIPYLRSGVLLPVEAL